ncbi:nucleoside monophosphate kinase [Candidatus Parcubacteria bacterium]|nr:nucleoside monophosphate kinase [Candidatus Parcubacteria bacterium]
MNQTSVIFIGRSGCGKGTQSGLLIDYFKTLNKETSYLSTGNEFRKLMAEKDNFTSKKVETILSEGGRPADFLCVAIIANYFKENFDQNKNIILDGGLRSLNEAKTVADVFHFYEIEGAPVFYIDVSHEWSVEKMKGRHRDDDSDEIFLAKKKWFDDEVVPAINYLENNTQFKFHKINGEQTVEQVHADILECLK